MSKTICTRSFLLSILLFMGVSCVYQSTAESESKLTNAANTTQIEHPTPPKLDTAAYNQLIDYLANGNTTGKWPVKTDYPLPGAILPFHRIVAFYGNLYSKQMGILGKLPKAEMLQQLKDEVAAWAAADTLIPVVPALHYIAVTAQIQPGKGGNYRLRMPFAQIDTVLSWAKEINALTFLDVQVGHGDVRTEVKALEGYLKMPNVHLGIDPEFSMKNGRRPGASIGSYYAEDINDVIDTLAKIVKENKILPKILVIHRFTRDMIKNYKDIKIVPEVQVIIDMDGFGSKELKRATWKQYIYPEPVQFTGFKIFYHNDSKGKNELFTPQELLQFTPKPIYIQYQ